MQTNLNKQNSQQEDNTTGKASDQTKHNIPSPGLDKGSQPAGKPLNGKEPMDDETTIFQMTDDQLIDENMHGNIF